MPLHVKNHTISSNDITNVGVFDTKVNRDGLLLHLDAADIDSYPGSGTVWFDISGNGFNANMSNISSSNWVLNGGVRSFETSEVTNQNFQIPSFPFPQNGRTYELWFNSKSYSIGWQTWFDDGGTERVLFGTSTNSIHVYPSNDFAAGLVANTWFHIAYTMVAGNNSTVLAYKNGVQIGTGVYGANLQSGFGTLYLLGDASTEVTSGFCSQMRVYNRVLNPYEIAENFQATRGRFGI
jgi:hypothetical protein